MVPSDFSLVVHAELVEKHNALVDYVDYVEERCSSDERATSGAFDDVYAKIAALEAKVSKLEEAE